MTPLRKTEKESIQLSYRAVGKERERERQRQRDRDRLGAALNKKEVAWVGAQGKARKEEEEEK